MSLRGGAIITSLLLLSFGTTGCKKPHSDMGQQDRYGTYQASDFFADGSSARPLVAGVVARDPENVPGIPYAAAQPAGIAGAAEIMPLDRRIPGPITAELLERGRADFDVFCAACHGRLGNGQGMIVQRGMTRPPSFHIDRLKSAPDAHFFNVITQGYGAMFPYNDRVPPEDRWAIIAYVRALQSATDVPGVEQSDEVKRALIAAGDRSTPPAPGGAR